MMKDNLKQAILLLSEGKLVSFPTETVYGLGADATQPDAVEKIYLLKNRPRFNPLIIHVSDFCRARRYGVFNEHATTLAQHYWPGPLTLVVPLAKQSSIAKNVTAGLTTIAIRCPNHPVAKKLLSQYIHPIAAPSANVSGYISPTNKQHVVDEFSDQVFVLPGDSSDVGIESTIVDCTTEGEVSILRPGFVTKEDLVSTLGIKVKTRGEDSDVNAPGQLKQHYSPITKLYLNVEKVINNGVCLNFGKTHLSGAFNLNLSPNTDLREAAANLFHYLRKADNLAQANNIKCICVAPIPNEGIGVAINDRLSRAASQDAL